MIRAMAGSDAADVAALIRTAFEALSVALDPPPSALRETGGSVLDHLAAGGGAVFDSAGIAGCVLWRVEAGGLYVCRLAVAPGRRREGIARHLLRAAEAEARQQGQPRLHVGVRLALNGNRRLFAAAGYVEGTHRTHEGCTTPTWVEAEKLL